MGMPDKNNIRSFDHLHKLSAKVLRSLIGILMRAGVPFDAFVRVARRIYVDIARNEFGIRGRKTNISRVAMLTGLTRAKVKQELDTLDQPEGNEDAIELDKVRHASRMLLGWHTDDRFLDENSQPRALEVAGSGPSFNELYESYSGKVVPATSMLKELLLVGAIDKLPDGKVIARSRSYTPQTTDPAALERICQAISDLGSTAGYNLFRDQNKQARFERFATNQLIPASREQEFREFLEKEGQEFLERADNWLSQVEADNSNEELKRIGVGLYQISSDPIKNEDN